jgi:putative methyltransferase (TIGR04325 family)
MRLMHHVHRLIDRAIEAPPLRQLFHRIYDDEFAKNRWENLFRGVFDTFDAARESAPVTRPIGYDNQDAAEMYANRRKRIYAADYPMLFWLSILISKGQCKIVDLGGHIGVSYYAYSEYLRYPPHMRWTVLDVPAVVQHGRELSKEMDKAGLLDFTDQVGDADGADILIALGSLQYLPDTLPERLAKLSSAPQHLLLNLVPIHPQHTYFTLQSIGTAFCPYRIMDLRGFLKSFEALGYTLVDKWENPEKKCTIPFHPARSLDRYYGFFFTREKHSWKNKKMSMTRA